MKNISFILNQKTRAKSSIRAQVTISGCKFTYSTGVSVSPKEFINGKTKSKALNMQLAAIEAAITNAVVYFDRQFRTPTLPEFRDKVNAFLTGDNAADLVRKSRDFFSFVDTYIDECKKSEETIRSYKTTRNKLASFFKNKQISFEDINLNFENKFKTWLLAQNYSRNYIGTLIKNIAVFMSVAKKVKKLHSNEDYESFKVEQETADSIYLSSEEIERIHHFNITLDIV